MSSPRTSPDDFLTIQQICEIYHISKSKLFYFNKINPLPPFRISVRKKYYPKNQIAEYFQINADNLISNESRRATSARIKQLKSKCISDDYVTFNDILEMTKISRSKFSYIVKKHPLPEHITIQNQKYFNRNELVLYLERNNISNIKRDSRIDNGISSELTMSAWVSESPLLFTLAMCWITGSNNPVLKNNPNRPTKVQHLHEHYEAPPLRNLEHYYSGHNDHVLRMP